jgi:hypothetical protein
MSTQVVTGVLIGTDGRAAPLKTTLTDGSDSQELKTNDTYTVTSQGIGRFCDGWTLASGYIQATTGIAYAYILRNGVNICNLTSISSKAIGNGYGAQPLSHRVRIIPGDQLIVRTEA